MLVGYAGFLPTTKSRTQLDALRSGGLWQLYWYYFGTTKQRAELDKLRYIRKAAPHWFGVDRLGRSLKI
jgi:hypothetical protein